MISTDKATTGPTYMIPSAELGLMNTAIGYSPATWSRFIAFPLTSNMQCLSWNEKRQRCIEGKREHIFWMVGRGKILNFVHGSKRITFTIQGVVSQSYLLRDLSHWLYAGSVQVAVVLAGLDEQMVLDVLFHLFPRRYKVVIAVVDFIFALRPRGIWKTTIINDIETA